jgi:hypothetical protein
MKKTLIGLALVLAIVVSVISGTMALYTTTIDKVADGSVVAKEFVLLENGTDTFTKNVKIAPSETTQWAFSVKNNDGSVISETAMSLNFTVNIGAATGKTAIAPLVVTIKDETGKVVGTQTGTGTLSFQDAFALKAEGQTHTYTVIVNWPSDNAVDSAYTSANGDFGTAVSVSVTGTQA